MGFNLCIMFLLIMHNLVAAADTINKDAVDARQYFFIAGIILTSGFVTMGLICLIYFTLKVLKRKTSEPQYYIEDISTEKDGIEHHDDTIIGYSEIPNINQIQPSLSISHMISSIKQSLEDLRVSLIPFSWSNAQQVYADQQIPVKEKLDLPI